MRKLPISSFAHTHFFQLNRSNQVCQGSGYYRSAVAVMLVKLQTRSLQKFLIIVSVAGLLGLAIALPTIAQGQPRFTTVFKFARKVNWGGAVLAPGEYVVAVSSDASPTVTVSQKSGAVVARIVPNAIAARPLSEDLAVTVDDGYGRNYVSTLYIGDTGTVLNFAAPDTHPQASNPNTQDRFVQGAVSGDSASAESGFLTIRNPRNQAMPYAEAQTIYLSACKVVEQEFSRADPVRPALTLLLGNDVEGLFYQQRQIQLKKWDKYRFAEGVIMLAVADLLPKDKKLSLAKLAVLETESTVDVSELKARRSLLPAGPRN